MLTLFYVPLAALVYVLISLVIPSLKTSPVNDFALTYFKGGVIGYFFAAHFDMTRRFMNATDQYFLPVFAQLLASAFHIVLVHLFVGKISLMNEMTGLAIADSITYFLMFFAIQLSSWFTSVSPTASLDKSLLQGLG